MPWPLPPNAGFGVYIHFPYCRSKCPYCDFAVEVAREIPHDRYARGILAELELRAEEFAPLGPAASVFFGGGTPSLWAPARVGEVLRAVERRFGLVPGAEVSLEANPELRDAAAFAALRDVGVNRLSLGVQSFADPTLRVLGRRHGGDEAALAIEGALAAGFPRVALDLIYGAPGQDPAAAARDARRAASLGVHHVSAYALTLDELAVDVPLARAERAGRVRVPDADAQADQGDALRLALTALGLRRYEISNFARDGAVSLHNLGYWKGRPYLGLGVGAVGATPARRYGNGRATKGYFEALERGVLPAGTSEPLDLETRWRERILLGLRLVAGLGLRELEGDFGPGRIARLHAAAKPLVGAGLVHEDGDRLRLTDRGLDLHNDAVARLI